MANARITTARMAISRIVFFARFFRRGRIVLRSFIDAVYTKEKSARRSERLRSLTPTAVRCLYLARLSRAGDTITLRPNGLPITFCNRHGLTECA
jgi:hypothetical protein